MLIHCVVLLVHPIPIAVLARRCYASNGRGEKLLTLQQDTVDWPAAEPPRAAAEQALLEEIKRFVGGMRDELKALCARRAAIGKRVSVLRQTIAGLADLFGPVAVDDDLRDLVADFQRKPVRAHAGLTDSCRQILQDSSQPLTLQQILRQFQEKYPAALAHHKRPSTSLRNVLNRLVSYGEAVQELTGDGLLAWKCDSILKRTS
jgi:hypothetical protein